MEPQCAHPKHICGIIGLGNMFMIRYTAQLFTISIHFCLISPLDQLRPSIIFKAGQATGATTLALNKFTVALIK